MSSKKKGNKTAKLKNLLITGSIEDEEEAVTEEIVVDDVVDIEDAPIDEDINSEQTEDMIDGPADTTPVVMTHDEIVCEPESESVSCDIEESIDDESTEGYVAVQKDHEIGGSICNDDIEGLRKEISDLKKQIFALRTENQNYLTSKEIHKSYMEAINSKDHELANKKMLNMLEQLSAMREDFFKLCNDMESKLDKFSSKDVLSSFEAYSIDMENILVDAGVFIGKFDYDKLNTVHQRIIDVIPTDDESKNGMIAERMSDGYEFNGRVLFKEKVKIYKFTENKTKSENEE